MSFLDNMKSKLGLDEEDYKDEATYAPDSFVPSDDKPAQPAAPRAFQSETVRETGRTINFNSTFSAPKPSRSSATANNSMRMVVVEPQNFDDAQQIAICLKESRPVVINFESADADTANRIVDFISGTVYALSGEIKKISHNVFLCAPSNVSVSFKKDRNSQQAATSGDPWSNN